MKKKVSVLAIDSTELMMALEELEKDKGIKKEAIIFCLKLLRILLSLPARMSTAKQITSV